MTYLHFESNTIFQKAKHKYKHLVKAYLILYTLLAIIFRVLSFSFINLFLKGVEVVSKSYLIKTISFDPLPQTALQGLCSGLYVSGSKDLTVSKIIFKRHMCTFQWAAEGVKIHFYKIQGNLHLTIINNHKGSEMKNQHISMLN